MMVISLATVLYLIKYMHSGKLEQSQNPLMMLISGSGAGSDSGSGLRSESGSVQGADRISGHGSGNGSGNGSGHESGQGGENQISNQNSDQAGSDFAGSNHSMTGKTNSNNNTNETEPNKANHGQAQGVCTVDSLNKVDPNKPGCSDKNVSTDITEGGISARVIMPKSNKKTDSTNSKK